MSIYKLWEQTQPHLPKVPRYSIGLKIDQLFIHCIELIYATLQSRSRERLTNLKSASNKLETIKFMLRIAWETRALDEKKYLLLSAPLAEVGRMIGGWQRKLEKETPT